MTDYTTKGMTAEQLEGRPVIGSDGAKIGTVADMYLDKETRQPEWALVSTGLFGSKSSFVPITDASAEGDALRVPFTKDQVKDAPRVDDDGEISQEDEATLSRHYGMTYSEAPSDTGLPQGGGRAQPRQGRAGDRDDAMTRSEEELRVQTARRPSQLVRLRKQVVTEDVNVTVPVQKEKLRVEREPITEANREAAMSGPEISEGEHEITLSEEEVVVDKQVVPKERVRLDKDVEREERQVSEQVRKEQIEVEEASTSQKTQK
jgi:uncharacterized protein (TIGR02271 family)